MGFMSSGVAGWKRGVASFSPEFFRGGPVLILRLIKHPASTVQERTAGF